MDVAHEKRRAVYSKWNMAHIDITKCRVHHNGSSTFILVFRVVQSQIKSPFKCNGKFLYVAESRLIYNFS